MRDCDQCGASRDRDRRNASQDRDRRFARSRLTLCEIAIEAMLCQITIGAKVRLRSTTRSFSLCASMSRSFSLSFSLCASVSSCLSFGSDLKVKWKQKSFYRIRGCILRSMEIIFCLTQFSGLTKYPLFQKIIFEISLKPKQTKPKLIRQIACLCLINVIILT